MATLRESRQRIRELEEGLIAIQAILDDFIEPDSEEMEEEE